MEEHKHSDGEVVKLTLQDGRTLVLTLCGDEACAHATDGDSWASVPAILRRWNAACANSPRALALDLLAA